MDKIIGAVFSGQGSQYEGMGRDLVDEYEYNLLKKIADDETFRKVAGAMQSDIDRTSIAQPAIFLNSITLYNRLKERGFDFKHFTGLSLGEYTALCAAGFISLENSIDLVCKRGRIMENGVAGKGTMTAVMKTSPDEIQKIIDDVRGDDILSISNINSPVQTVAGGSFEAIERFENECRKRNIRRIARLNVQGPFHTEFLKNSAHIFAEELDKVEFKESGKYVYSNYNACIHNRESIVENLEKQMYSTVLFEKCIREMIDEGCRTFIEIGPGKVLGGFIKKIDRNTKIFNIQSLDDIEKVEKSI